MSQQPSKNGFGRRAPYAWNGVSYERPSARVEVVSDEYGVVGTIPSGATDYISPYTVREWAGLEQEWRNDVWISILS